MTQKTTEINAAYAQKHRRWMVIDAKQAVLGRVASKAANLLRGKHKSFFMPSVDCGDFVVVKNASAVRLTGEKAVTKTYFRHSGHAKGAKVIPFKLQMDRDARQVIKAAVHGMLPTTRLRQHQMRRLKVYNGDTHPHAAQKLEEISV